MDLTIDDTARRRARLVCIYGASGVGKDTLARNMCHGLDTEMHEIMVEAWCKHAKYIPQYHEYLHKSGLQGTDVRNCLGHYQCYLADESYDWEGAVRGLNEIRNNLATWDVCPEESRTNWNGNMIKKSKQGKPLPDWARYAIITGAASCINGKVTCLLYTSPSPRDAHESRMPSSA